jgi:uncharacterized OsmC-like protein
MTSAVAAADLTNGYGQMALLSVDGRAHKGEQMDQFDVVVGTGSFRSIDAKAIQFPHRWTSEGVTVEAAFSGAHLLHLAVAGCVLNDMYREAATLGIQIDGVRVSAAGGFDTEAWTSTGITYSVELLSPASAQDFAQLLDRVDDSAEIPRAIRAGAMVQRANVTPSRAREGQGRASAERGRREAGG